ncbi:hypothetical protein K474DRAFT_1674702 [Panus rudis PR-1116 ss-1]|nr:hypothetical protein K474DRAFT_1674702 [Panus rudis PR-1116 ss-1]
MICFLFYCIHCVKSIFTKAMGKIRSIVISNLKKKIHELYKLPPPPNDFYSDPVVHANLPKVQCLMRDPANPKCYLHHPSIFYPDFNCSNEAKVFMHPATLKLLWMMLFGESSPNNEFNSAKTQFLFIKDTSFFDNLCFEANPSGIDYLLKDYKYKCFLLKELDNDVKEFHDIFYEWNRVNTTSAEPTLGLLRMRKKTPRVSWQCTKGSCRGEESIYYEGWTLAHVSGGTDEGLEDDAHLTDDSIPIAMFTSVTRHGEGSLQVDPLPQQAMSNAPKRISKRTHRTGRSNVPPSEPEDEDTPVASLP